MFKCFATTILSDSGFELNRVRFYFLDSTDPFLSFIEVNSEDPEIDDYFFFDFSEAVSFYYHLLDKHSSSVSDSDDSDANCMF